MKEKVQALIDAVNALKDSANKKMIWDLKTLASAIDLDDAPAVQPQSFDEDD